MFVSTTGETKKMCTSARIATNNGVKHHGFAPRIDKKDTPKRTPKSEQQKLNKLHKKDPKRFGEIHKKKKAAEQDKQQQAQNQVAQERIDRKFKERLKRNGEVK